MTPTVPRRARNLVRVAAAFTALTVLAGCSSTNDGAGQDAATESQVVAETGSSVADGGTSGAPDAETPPADDTTAPSDSGAQLDFENRPVNAFGDTFDYDDGISLEVSAPEVLEPGESASFDKGAAAQLVYQIHVTNKTGSDFDPATFTALALSGDAEAPPIFDSANNVGTTEHTILAIGQETTFAIGFSVFDPEDVVMYVRPNLDYHGSIFATQKAATGEPSAGSLAGLPLVESAPTLGSRFRIPEGLIIAVSEPKEFTPDEWSMSEDAAAYLEFTVSITNDSDVQYEPSGRVEVESGGMDAGQITDAELGIISFPGAIVLPGRSTTFRVGFGVADANDISLSVTPTYVMDPVLFTAK